MDIFSGKKALCFIALPHHNRFLLPVMQALSRRGMEVVFSTAAAEAAFEITLNQAGLPYIHAMDYATAEVTEQVSAAFRELRPVWLEKILAHPVLQAIPLPIQDKVIRAAVENVHCFQRMLEVEKPDLLLALHEVNSWGKILGYLSHVQRIPYITFQEGFSCGLTPFYRFHTDYSTACVLWGEAARQVLLAAGSHTDKLFMLGNIHIWHARQRATQEEAMATTRAALDIGPEKKVVLFLLSHNNYTTFKPTIFLDWLKVHKDVTVIFKWHPASGKDIIERVSKSMQGVSSILNLQDFDTYALLGISDVCVVVGQSSSGIEALAFDKPLIEVCLPDQNHSFAAQGTAEQARGFDDVGDKIEAILTQGIPPERQQRMEQYIAHHYAFQDDKTVERIVEMAGEMLRTRADKESPALSTTGKTRFPCSLILPVDNTPLESVVATLRGIVAHTPPELFEVLIVNAAADEEARELLSSLEGDVRIIEIETANGDREWRQKAEEGRPLSDSSVSPPWSFAACCNRAAAEAQGKYLVFLKPGFIPCPGWLEGLLNVAEADHQQPTADGDQQSMASGLAPVGVVGGRVLNDKGLIWHLGVAFDINQSPFPLYRLLPAEFVGAQKQREFQAVEVPFLVSREQFCHLGGFSTKLVNRFEDIDFCLRAREAGLRVLYTPQSTILRAAASWQPPEEQDPTNRMRFYTRWTGSLWQDDDRYLKEDGLDHDTLTALYRELAARVAAEAQTALAQVPD